MAEQAGHVILNDSPWAFYDEKTGAFDYSKEMTMLFPALQQGVSPWKAFVECGALPREESERLEGQLSSMLCEKVPSVGHTYLQLEGARGQHSLWDVLLLRCEGGVVMVFLQPEGATDPTGLPDWETFLISLREVLLHNPTGAVVYFDVQRFKAINNMFGVIQGDRLLSHIADCIQRETGSVGFGCHIDADRFAFYVRMGREEVAECVDRIFDAISTFDLPSEVVCNAGIYMVEGQFNGASAAVDKAMMAQNEIKGNYDRRYRYYNEELQVNLIDEHEIIGTMRTALEEGQFVIFYQPQYNHSTGRLLGAEALVRWEHPEKGMVPPAAFLPVFEKSGFVTNLDKYVFESICKFLRHCIDEKIPTVHISVNFTRQDLFSPSFLKDLETVRKKYNVPAKLIHIEITESSALGNSYFINQALRDLHCCGYVVEMDDFGSGYSSLNILKDLDIDVVKLDTAFFERGGQRGRGGIILSSVVRMVNWLGLPMIAEGVETAQQADFLKSIGCNCVQGFLYAKPMSQKEFEGVLHGSHIGIMTPQMEMLQPAENLWSSDSMDSLIFSNYVGPAAIFKYQDGKAEILRVNGKYLRELGMNLAEKNLVGRNFLLDLDEEDRGLYLAALHRAVETREEQECESWRTIDSPSCGKEHIYIRSNLQVLVRNHEEYVFYAMIRNMTAEKEKYKEMEEGERRFKAASEQIQIFYWEYDVATHEMRPCFRCMRELGLPALVENYPEPAIEMGIFPPEIADEYREWHRRIDAGEKYIEGVLPLTMDRVPFRVRYTTEFDEYGRPIRAYGSATPV